GNQDFWALKIDQEGNNLWNQTYGGTGVDAAFSLDNTTDGGFVFAGRTSSFGAGIDDVWIVKLDQSLNEEWNLPLGGTASEYAWCIREVADRNYIVCGGTYSYGSGGQDYWLVRLGSSTGHISGTVSPVFEGIAIDLLDLDNELLEATLTDANGEFGFSDLDAGDYWVQLVEPIGYTADDNPRSVTVEPGETAPCPFVLTALVTANNARSKGYWKHQVKANLSGKGNKDYTTAELEAFAEEIFAHFYGHPTNPIEVDGVTYVGDPAEALTVYDLETMLNINQGGSTMNERACQQYLAVLLNVVSLKLPQGIDASEDGATVAQTLIYINDLLGVDDEFAKDLAETLNQGELIAAGIVPLDLPNIIFTESNEEMLAMPHSFSYNSPAPNPFNPTTTFSYELPEAVQVSLAVYDISGRLVATLVDGYRNAGTYQTEFHAEGLASGVYLYHLNAGEHQMTGKMVLMK
ncbi:T9SS type A sorting domain-containing protein, partial [bacterium]|nr:T9SS type A sorting domain-containing protein [bacterium]